jgi:tetratricopeptide (TPR) repeat protein
MAMAGNYGDAFACWEKIHGPSLDHLSSQKNRASLLYKSKKFEEALTVLSDAAKMYPDDSVVWEWIGRIQQKQGRHADALKAFWKAMKKNRLNEDVIKGIDTSLRALGRHKEADELRAMSAGQKKQE